MRTSIAIALLAFSAASTAATVPQPLQFDQRVREVAYNPEDVVTIYSAYGISTHIKFAPDETITHAILGDSVAWEATPVGNNLFIKPIEHNADTNLSVVTNKHVYGFDLKAAPKATDRVFFQVKFIYPDQDLARQLATQEIQARTAQLAETRARLERLQVEQAAKLDNAMRDAEIPLRRGVNYWVKGSDEASPDEAFDDGTFTYFRFKGNREFPAVYLRDKDGNESLVNTTVKGDTILVQRIAKDYILRKGTDVAQVTNPNYDRIGIANETGTITPAVTRAVRGEIDPLPQTLPTRNPAHKLVGAIAPVTPTVIPPTKTIPSAPPALPPAPLVEAPMASEEPAAPQPLPQSSLESAPAVETVAEAAPAPAVEPPAVAPIPLVEAPQVEASKPVELAPLPKPAAAPAPAAPIAVEPAPALVAAEAVAPPPVAAPPTAAPLEVASLAPASPAETVLVDAAPAPVMDVPEPVYYTHTPAVIQIVPEPHPPLVPRSEPELGANPESPILVDVKSTANLRSMPSAGSAKLGDVSRGDLVTAIGRDRTSKWLLVEDARGQRAWLSTALVAPHGRLPGLPIYPTDAISVAPEHRTAEAEVLQ